MVGMRDVAKEAGVSLSTVSLVVNKTGYVSDDMRARVKAAMKELNYVCLLYTSDAADEL